MLGSNCRYICFEWLSETNWMCICIYIYVYVLDRVKIEECEAAVV